MMIDRKQTILFVAGTLISGVAMAGPECTEAPRDQWMSETQMQRKIIDGGYVIERFKIDDSCYEIYGRNGQGQKVEIYFDPVTGEIVKQEIED